MNHTDLSDLFASPELGARCALDTSRLRAGDAVQFTTQVQHVIYHGDADFIIFEVEGAGDRAVVITGTCAMLAPGVLIEGAGHITEHARFGKQVQADWLCLSVPHDEQGMRLFLCSGVLPGIGAGVADLLLERFGSTLTHVLDTDPKQLLQIKGIGPARLEAIVAAWSQTRALRHIIIKLAGGGIGSVFALRVWREWGGEAVKILDKNPYELTQIRGLSFARADVAAQLFGLTPACDERADAALLWCAQVDTSHGHTISDSDALVRGAAQMIDQPVHCLERARTRCVGKAKLIEPGVRQIGLGAVVSAEDTVARVVAGHCGAREAGKTLGADVAEAFNSTGAQYDPTQHAALAHALSQRLSIITGGPGTGKTTILKALLFATRGRDVKLCAPTGRAAQRMEQITGYTASTIHRMLWDGELGDFCADPIECDYLVVDEVSMIDVHLMAALLRRTPAHAHIILVGDVDQLPPIGPGACLRDMIDAGVPTARLDHVFRFSSDSAIAGGAQDILSGRSPVPGPGLSLIEQENNRDNAEIVATILGQMERYGEDSVQTLIPMHKGTAGVSEINKALRDRLRTRVQREAALWSFCVGDRVMHTTNNYDLGVMNGEIGKVVAVHPGPGACLDVQFGADNEVSFKASTKNDLRLAYAITVHKSQGGQFPCVVFVLTDAHYPMLDRTLTYTAATRAETNLVIIGSHRALLTSLRRTASHQRQTRLRSLLDGYSALS